MKVRQKLRQAIDSLYAGGQATAEAYTPLVLECVRVNDVGQAKRLQSHMDLHCFTPNDTFLHNRLLHTYARLGKISDARNLFDKMPQRDIISWNTILSVYAKSGSVENLRALFYKMPFRDSVSYNTVIAGLAGSGFSSQALEVFLRMNREGFEPTEYTHEMQLGGFKPDDVTVSNVLGAYFQSGLVDEAIEVFNLIKNKDKVSWTTMIVGYVQNGKEEDALNLFAKMLAEGVKPDSFTISSVISSCAKLAYLCNGQVVHGKAILLGVDNDLLVSSALVDMYCKCGITKEAWIVFDMMPSRNVVSWNVMIRGYAQNGQDLEALVLYEKLLQQKLKPDSITFVAVLSACNHAGLIEEGRIYFDSISKRYALVPTLDHYACMINLLGRSGCMTEAIDLVNNMPHEPNSLIWSTLLSVCAIKGDIENGEMAAKRLFELEPLNAGPYIMLSNMYATCGRWEDVASVRSLMKSKNVKKFAAYSWIEIDNEVHKFVAEDATHPQTEIIYEELGRLIKKLQEAGFMPDTKLVLHNVEEEEKFASICYHSEKLALAYGLIKNPHATTPIRIMKNIRVCGDCHMFMKLVSKVIGRPIILRDSNRFHHFVGGSCSCKDYW
uniref:DYW domain-containing protein n=1 Tax=Gossypium raimondii TaxID=29730 RepID=A0A0D2U830_GOSRA|nr:hypothetical protein B456_010G075400 [Gossypium raimondii]